MITPDSTSGVSPAEIAEVSRRAAWTDGKPEVFPRGFQNSVPIPHESGHPQAQSNIEDVLREGQPPASEAPKCGLLPSGLKTSPYGDAGEGSQAVNEEGGQP